MKAIAAVAIARSFTKEETVSAGLFVSGIIGFAAATGLLRWVGHVIPIPVVKGIQVGAGLSLVISAGTTLLAPLSWTPPPWRDNLLWAVGAFILLLLTAATTSPTTRTPRIPFALLVFTIGIIAALISLHNNPTPHPSIFGLWHPQPLLPSLTDFRTGALTAGLGQLPLTTLNSIIAVAHLAADLLPASPAPSTTGLGLSVAAMNLAGAWFGAMPVCHGSGGLAAQVRFGARSGASVIMLGTAKLLLGLVVSEAWLVGCLRRFPRGVLGIMVIAAGVELAKVGEGLNGAGARDIWEEDVGNGVTSGKRVRESTEAQRKDRWMVMMVTVAGMLAFKNDAVGFGAGLLWHLALKAPEWWEERIRGGRSVRLEEGRALLEGP